MPLDGCPRCGYPFEREPGYFLLSIFAINYGVGALLGLVIYLVLDFCLHLPIWLVLMAVSVVVYAVSFLLIRLLSRYRELSADRSGALLTGQPSALKSALVKVTGDIARIPTKDLRTQQPLNAFYFTPAAHLAAKGSKLANIFSTHPSLERRLAELDKVQEQLGRTAG